MGCIDQRSIFYLCICSSSDNNFDCLLFQRIFQNISFLYWKDSFIVNSNWYSCLTNININTWTSLVMSVWDFYYFVYQFKYYHYDNIHGNFSWIKLLLIWNQLNTIKIYSRNSWCCYSFNHKFFDIQNLSYRVKSQVLKLVNI